MTRWCASRGRSADGRPCVNQEGVAPLEAALDLLHTWGSFPRVPGIATVLRLAVRIDCGRSPEEAAAREYLYRWELALRSPIFGVPHTLGM